MGVDEWETLGGLDKSRLITAYGRRKRWEAQALAVEVWGLLGASMQSKNGKRGKAGRRRVPASEFMKETGTKWA